jgi:very-short-patch-repair endonuclease
MTTGGWAPTAGTGRLVRAAAGQWRRGLVDVSGSNRRLFYRPLILATLDLEVAEAGAVRRLLSGQSVRIGALFPDDGTPDGTGTHLRARKAADAIWRKAVETEEETGANPARVVVGAATFLPPDGAAKGRPFRAPLILLPVRFVPAPGTRSVGSIVLDGEAEVNSALRYVLTTQHGADLDEDALLTTADPDGPGGVVVDPELLAEAAAKALQGEVPGWQLLPHLTVDYFGSDRELMLRDLTDETVLAAHPVVAAMAGDAAAQAHVAGEPLPPPELDPEMAAPDHVDPAQEFLVLDADASQQRVIDLALAGRSLVVQGPPGTGKSQTIANLIATFAAHGRSVLFVAQKRAAIEAVTDRLDKHGLGHLLLEVFDASMRRSHVLAQLSQSLDGMVAAPAVDVSRLHQELTRSRDLLVGHRDALHQGRPELGGSTVTELYRRLYAVDPEAQTQDRLTFGAVSGWGLDGVERRAAELAELVRLGALEPDWQDAEGWDPGRVVSDELAVAGYDAAVEAASALPGVRSLGAAAARECGLAEPRTAGELDAELALLRRAADVSAAVDPALLDVRQVDDDQLRRLAHGVADRDLRRRDRAGGVGVGWWGRRRMRREALRLTGTTDRGRASALLREIIALRPAFEGVVVVAASTPQLVGVGNPFGAAVARIGGLVRGVDLASLPWDELATELRRLVGDPRRARMPRAHALAADLDASGATPIVAGLRERLRAGLVVPPEDAASRLRWAALSTLLDHLVAADPALAAAAQPGALPDAATRFGALDRAAVEVNAARVRRSAAEAALRRLTEHGDQQRYLRAELNKKRRLRSLRELVDRAPDAVLAAAPCWAMSPLLVSRYLPAAPLFDVVVYDEASQVTVPDAVPSILRGRQVVVAGDDRQLPPTSVFTKLLDDADDEGAGAAADEDAELSTSAPPAAPAPVAGTDYASVLTALAGMLPARTLLWHYRSRDERLIATSNAHVYGGRLVTFPGPQSDRVLRHVVVPPSRGLGAHNKSPQAEVARVVELCLEHAERQRDVQPERRQSLGVIAAGTDHAARVEKALVEAVVAAEDPYLAAFFDLDAAEPVFVKNIERVQGDERDHVILTVGYGPSADGRLRYLWGPLLGEYGVNRLNVAISRARSRMTVVTSFAAEQLPETGNASAGYQLLRQFVLFAAAPGARDADEPGTPALDPFERDVYERLVDAGLQVDARYGVAGYRLDFAVRHPEDPSRHVLAVETDGAAYGSGWTARERDRLRREHLEALGWRFHRIWSADHWRDPEAEVAGVRLAVETAVARLAKGLPAADDEAPVPAMSTGEAPAAVAPARRPPAWVTPKLPINSYSERQLVELVRWLRADGVLRLPDDELRALMTTLGLTRRSANIVARLEQAMRAASSG